MSQKYCCVPGCVQSGDSHPVLHLFPNPDRYPDRFRSWVLAVGGDIIGLSNKYIYANRRVCHRHFEDKDCCRFNKISQLAIPIKHLPGLHKIPQFTLSNRRYQRNIDNEPSTSKGTFELFGPEFNMSEDLLQENLPAMSVNIENKENIPQSSLMESDTCVTQPTMKPDIHYNIEIADIQTSTQKPSTQNMNITVQPVKRCRKIGPMSKEEKKLYQKLRNMQIKLSKCRNLCKKHAASVKMSSNVMTNQSFLNTIENMTSAAKILTLLQFREQRKKSKGCRFTLKEKMTSLFIKKSPKAYRLLRKIFLLPSPQTLEKLVRQAVITPGINEKLFQSLKNSSNKMKAEHKLCILLFDEVSLEANIRYSEKEDKINGLLKEGNATNFANHATVFMIRGLLKNYKQPVAYTFCHGSTKAPELKKYITEIIKKLQEAGFQVIATVCDQGSNNRKAIKSLVEERRKDLIQSGTELKWNTFNINGQEKIPLYDPPHLLKGIRNNLKYINEENKTCVAKWEHLRLLHAENPAYKGIRLMPKLTDKHVIPEKIGKMKVKFATQIFSQTVSSNMGYLADKGILPAECKDTADLLLLFDKIFDSMNGSYKNKSRYAKPYLNPLTPQSAHHKLWQESKKIIRSMTFVNEDGKSSKVPTLENFVWTLEGLEHLIKKLSQEHKITSIWTRHLNQDPLENFFSSVRSHGCRNNNPSPAAFQSSFTALIINNLKCDVVGSNCEEDYCESLQAHIMCPGVNSTNQVQELNVEHLLINVTPLEEKKSNVRGMASLAYVSGFLLKNCKRKIFKQCKICNDVLIDKKQENEYIRSREFAGRGWLCYPNENFIFVISQIQDIFNIIINDSFMNNNLKEYIKTVLYLNIDTNLITVCEEHKNDLTQFLFNYTIIFLLRSFCKDINNILTGKRKKDGEDFLQSRAQMYYEKSYKNKKK